MPRLHGARNGKRSGVPDIMNDPEYATNVKTAGTASDEPDTCRICRGESTKDEPLFYPCKCSGSIKFVHQECLMEWLSHSQKKHCELCKTPFRFTKLYDPHMPEVLPTTVVLRRAAVHAAAYFLLWCRGILVGSVWLLWLPWCMRYVWRSLFWVADAGWTDNLGTTLTDPTDGAHLGRLENATLVPNITVAGAVKDPGSPLHSHLFASFFGSANASRHEPLTLTLIKSLLATFKLPPIILFHGSAINATLDRSGTNRTSLHGQSSLLSDLSFFASLSPFPALNRVIIDILEGQIITLFVVVAFILVFLIREWVVQQQPLINMVALHAENNGMQAAAAQAGNQHELQEEQAALDEGNMDEPPQHVGEQGAGQRPERMFHGDHSDMSPSGLLNNTPGHETAVVRPMQQAADAISNNHGSSRHLVDDLSQALPQNMGSVFKSGGSDEGITTSEELTYEQQRAIVENLRQWRQTNANLRGISDDNDLSHMQSQSEITTNAVQPRNGYSDESSMHDRLEERRRGPSRPGMPSKKRSFLAADIRRDIEECEKPKDNVNRLDGPLSDILNDGPASESSSDSWQYVPNSEPTLATDDFISGMKLKEKGKDKALEESRTPEINRNGALLAVDDNDSNGNRQRSFTNPEEYPTSSATGAPQTQYTGLEAEQCNRSDSQSFLHGRSPEVGGEIPDTASRVEPDDTRGVEEPENANTTEIETHNEPQGLRPEIEPSWYDRIINWFWDDAAPAQAPTLDDEGDEERLVEDIADEDPFVAIQGDGAPRAADNIEGQAQPDPEVAEAAAQAGLDINDPEAMEDAEDLEGILELIGMQGPITGLFQNAMFSAVLISATVTGAVWLPYLWGKVVLVFIGSPVSFIKAPLQFISAFSDLIADSCLLMVGMAVFGGLKAVEITLEFASSRTSLVARAGWLNAYISPAKDVSMSAQDRIAKFFARTVSGVDSDWLHLTLNAHAALTSIKSSFFDSLGYVRQASHDLIRGTKTANIEIHPGELLSVLYRSCIHMLERSLSVLRLLINPGALTVTLEPVKDLPRSVSPNVVYWSAWDRLLAVLAGYIFFALAGALYLKRGKPFSSSPQGKKIENVVAELLQQAGGIMKVILIISIEMIVFPLYCGVLLDVALLPLFGTASIWTRLDYASRSPWISGFVHWFIGTCYMFHFALFVSMCRKIMRNGVLYFIRDPDDPTFHPVRDVLERNVTTQLRKITFSALVYGALVILCLGGVVWAIYFIGMDIFPLHWSSTEPVLEFSIDLLLYYFITPLVIRYAKPSDGLHAMYKWWFRTCARALRLSHFLFDEPRPDEEGRHVRRTWASWLARKKGNVDKPVIGEDRRLLADDRELDVYFLWEGRRVRAPASDQVRIPKGAPVFVEVDHRNKRVDGQPEDDGIHASTSDKTTVVYIPPFFRTRIALFIFTIWAFAAATGVGMTVVPLLFGRKVLSYMSTGNGPVNDIYAFSIGVYTLGGVLYAAVCMRNRLVTLRSRLGLPSPGLTELLSTVKHLTFRAAAFFYVYALIAVALPLLFALVIEFYLLIPLHTCVAPESTHTIHLVQDWTLGFLYGRIAAYAVFSDQDSRPARVLRAVFRDGYLKPSPRLATRCFILPASLVFLLVLLVPHGLAQILNATYFAGSTEASKVIVQRMVFPSVLMVGAVIWSAGFLARATHSWTQRVRDEVYLIGERLHNFGDRRSQPAKSVAVAE